MRWRLAGPAEKHDAQWKSVNRLCEDQCCSLFGRAEAMARVLIGWEGLVLTAPDANGCGMRYAPSGSVILHVVQLEELGVT